MDDDPSVTADEIGAYARRARLDPDRFDPAEQAAAIEVQDDLVARLDELEAPTPPDRECWEPTEDEDPNAAFLSRCDLQRTDDGVLSGLTVAVKDNIAVAGLPMTAGSPLFANHVPAEDATVVDRILDAGGRIIGKANMDEFALGGDAATMRFRLARNPNDPDHQPGGSSAGSGVAVADGLADVALGSDTGGSVRFPASFCGVVGLKPSRGLVPTTGFVQFSKLNDEIGVLADSVEDAARTLDAIAGADPRDAATDGAISERYVGAVDGVDAAAVESLTVGVPKELFGGDPAVDATVRAALDELAAAGATVREVSIPDFEYAVPAWWAIAMIEVAAYVERNGANLWQRSVGDPAFTAAVGEALAERSDELGDYPAEVLLYGQHLLATDGPEYYARAQCARELVTAGVADALAAVDVLAGPTTPMVAPAWEGESYLADSTLDEAVRTTGPFNLTGNPAVSVPCGTNDGLPVGLQFVGPRGADAATLRAAAIWERIDG
ncbi:amidase [Halolamina sediminis]|uniref:amidase n=1 Tax=Halolamina sediminis TaxID=1480675 RepID=UPI0006B599AC|nr:amidase family protein [Halolamina sediminis]